MASYEMKVAHDLDPDTHEPKQQSFKEYASTRILSLRPPMNRVSNPFSLLRLLNTKQWLFFLVGFLGWTWDAFDFFTVSLTVQSLAESFERSKAEITWGITLVLMMRSVGSIIFGIASDRYGRKWPFVVNMVLFILFELATGFCSNFKQFLAVRALYGIAMGGLYGNAAATALEDCPKAAAGILSGILQQGYAFGYLLATVFARALVNTTQHGWRPLFWFGACPPILLIVFRLLLPETEAYQARIAGKRGNSTGAFIAEGKVVLRRHWKLLLYMVLLMAWFNCMSHGSQDLYPLMLQNQYNKSDNAVTVTQVVANTGAILGGTSIGYLSQIFGRRLSIIMTSILGAALLYPYCFTGNTGVITAAFFEQMCVQGAWGVVPVYLVELSPPAFRTFVVGTSYQLGNLISSAVPLIEAKLGEYFPLPAKRTHGDIVERYEYGKVIFILMAGVYFFVIILTLLGPEYLGRNFDVFDDKDLRDAVGDGAAVTKASSSPGSQKREIAQEKERNTV